METGETYRFQKYRSRLLSGIAEASAGLHSSVLFRKIERLREVAGEDEVVSEKGQHLTRKDVAAPAQRFVKFVEQHSGADPGVANCALASASLHGALQILSRISSA